MRVARALRMLLPFDRSGWAIAAGYLSFLSLAAWPLAQLAIIAGMLGLRDVRTKGLLGKRRAVVGIVGGLVVCVAAVVVLAYLADR